MSGELNMFSSYFDYRIAILGEPVVGKTSILNQLVWKRFDEEYIATLETDMEYVHEYNGSTYVCLIVDTAGVREFPAMRNLSITRSNGFLIVFDLTNEETFDKAALAVKEVLSYKANKYIKIILVGNKRDLTDQVEDISEMARDLSIEMEKNSYIHCQYFEVSARDNRQITNMFEKLLDLYDSHEKQVFVGLKRQRGTQRKHSARYSMTLEPLDEEEMERNKRYSLPKGFFGTKTATEKKSLSPNLLKKDADDRMKRYSLPAKVFFSSNLPTERLSPKSPTLPEVSEED